jgi:sn-glycerol 3-phosphate transport system ATP-binding protein
VAKFFGTPQMNVLRGNVNYDSRSVEIDCYGSVLLGIRPDSASLAPAEMNDLTLVGNVASFASLGNATLVNVDLDGQEVQFKLAGQHEFTNNQALEVSVAQDVIHYFDVKSGKKLENAKVG